MRALQKFIKVGIPSDWKQTRLKDICIFAYGSPLSELERMGGNIPVFGSNGIVGWHNSAFVKGPGIIIGRKGTAGEVTWSESDFFPIDTTFYIKIINQEIDIKWLFYLLSVCNFEKFSGATGVPGLNRNDAYKFIVPLPPLPEQKTIAAILSKVDEAIAAVEDSIKAAEKVKKALMQNLLTGKLKPDGTWRSDDEFYTDEKLGKIPKGWEKKQGKQLFTVYGSSTPDKIDFSCQGDCIYMKVSDFNLPENDFYIKTGNITFSLQKNPRFVYCEPNFIVISKRGEAIRKNRVKLLAKKTALLDSR